jgi:hypothetical protein
VSEERSVSAVLHDILRDVQEMLRAEIRLAKAEIRDDAKRAASSGAWVAVGAAGVLSGWIFLLWTVVYALAAMMPMWAATLVVAVVLSAIGAALVMLGLQRVRTLQPGPERAVESVKETLEWIRQPTK